MVGATKKCRLCKKRKAVKAFSKWKYAKDGLSPECKDCCLARHRRVKYGVDKNWVRKHSKNGCEICHRRPPRGNRGLGVDHCHKTKKARGILCIKCNHGIGQFKDSIKLLKSAIAYLRRK